jgi:hypothetical protein
MCKLELKSRLGATVIISSLVSENLDYSDHSLTTAYWPTPPIFAIAISSSDIPQTAGAGTLWGHITPASQNGAPTLRL